MGTPRAWPSRVGPTHCGHLGLSWWGRGCGDSGVLPHLTAHPTSCPLSRPCHKCRCWGTQKPLASRNSLCRVPGERAAALPDMPRMTGSSSPVAQPSQPCVLASDCMPPSLPYLSTRSLLGSRLRSLGHSVFAVYWKPFSTEAIVLASGRLVGGCSAPDSLPSVLHTPGSWAATGVQSPPLLCPQLAVPAGS